ncbi:hypothetical protein, partial [Neisseria meningitidis]|uniref:hypothetical protein n=1 Tax=Neisseria meningitidis TaxID=487 RepID=UPI001C83040E
NIRPTTLIKSGINAANNFICYPFLKRHGCLIKKMFLNLKDFAPHSRRGGAVGTPPSRLSPIPPRFSAICDIRRKVRCFACLSAKVSEAERFAGD